MKKIVALVLALVLLTAFGVTSLAYGYWTSEYVTVGTGEMAERVLVHHYIPVYGEITDESDLPSDNFVKAPVIPEPVVEPNPDTGLHFGF